MSGKRPRHAFEADLQKQESPYVFYGTSLPPIDEHTRDDGSFVPVWKQEVTDDRGRKRLHGAFTGGFSAGYYNTVGSKEGWTPSTFVSSRQNRQKDGGKSMQQRPEDFMDEDDLREAEEARNLATSESFAGFSTTDQDPLRAGSLMDILRPSDDTIGTRLLKKMGWKQGQGIGPKVRRKANSEDGDLEREDIYLFAPENSPMISFSRKTDHKGLGYEGEIHLGPTAVKPTSSARSKQASDEEDGGDGAAGLFRPKTTAIKSANRGFGIGVLNDTGSDDEDPYEMGPKISYGKIIGGRKKSKNNNNNISQTNANPSVKSKPVFLSKRLLATKANGFRRSRDGRLPLEGFVLADELDGFASISLQEDNMKPPVVPTGWKSTESPVRASEGQAYVSTADAAKASSLNAQGRAALLGEKQLPSKSVFDFLSPAARNKLVSTSGRADLPQAGGQAPPPGYEATEEAKQKHMQDLVPQLDPQVALQALSRGVSGWMPYAEDASKRDRYRTFLEIRAGLLDQLPTRAANATQDDWVNEMNEFARAAQVFKPATGLMASRFTSSSAAPKSVHEGEDHIGDNVLLQKPVPKPEDPAVVAAKMGMFGPMTRTVINFYPTRLVCKRFNVQPPENTIDPGSGAALDSSSGRRSRSSQFDAYQYGVETPSGPTLAIKDATHEEDIETSQPLSEDLAAQVPVANIDPEKNDALEKERPGQDVFRAVFGDDSDDEDD